MQLGLDFTLVEELSPASTRSVAARSVVRWSPLR